MNLKNIRMLDWWVIAVILVGVIAILAPHQLAVTAYKLSLVSLAAVVGYHIDRSVFPYARPDDILLDQWQERVAAWMRRAIIIAGAMISVSLGA